MTRVWPHCIVVITGWGTPLEVWEHVVEFKQREECHAKRCRQRSVR